MRCAILINGVSSQSLLVLSGVLSYLFKKTHQHICGQGSLVRLIQNNAAVPAFKKIYTVKQDVIACHMVHGKVVRVIIKKKIDGE